MVLFVLTVFALSSGWLYSELFGKTRNYIISLCDSKYFILRKISYLGMCQLCCAFWIALCVEWYFYAYYGIAEYIIYALVAAGLSWTLGAFTTMCLWFRAMCMDMIEKNRIK
jgi:hypothetical protein